MQSHESLKAEEEGREEMKLKGRSERFRAWKLNVLLALKMEIESYEPRNVDLNHQKLRRTPRQQLARKWGPQSYSHKELNLTNNLDNIGSRFIPRGSKKYLSPAHTLIQPGETWSRKPAEPGIAQTSDLQNCNMINLCCFKPLSIW